jgi:hypothetical protein
MMTHLFETELTKHFFSNGKKKETTEEFQVFSLECKLLVWSVRKKEMQEGYSTYES